MNKGYWRNRFQVWGIAVMALGLAGSTGLPAEDTAPDAASKDATKTEEVAKPADTETSADAEKAAKPAKPAKKAKAAKTPKAQKASVSKDVKSLEIVDIVTGKGKEAKAGMKVTV